jgi:hypothetical protein
MTPEVTYYVDVVNLPVAAPRHGASSQNSATPPTPPLPQPEPKSSMALPPPVTQKPAVKSAPVKLKTGCDR